MTAPSRSFFVDATVPLTAQPTGDELVTYDFSTLALKAGSDEDDFLNDND